MSLPDDPVSSNEGVPANESSPFALPSNKPLQGGQRDGEILEWERWNLREDPRRWGKLFLLIVIILLVGAVLVVSLPLTAAIGLGLALVVALLPYLLPRRFELRESGVSIHQGFYTSRRQWSEIESYQKVASGYFLRIRPKEGSKPPRLNLLTAGSSALFLPFPLESEKLMFLEGELSRHIFPITK